MTEATTLQFILAGFGGLWFALLIGFGITESNDARAISRGFDVER